MQGQGERVEHLVSLFEDQMILRPMETVRVVEPVPHTSAIIPFTTKRLTDRKA